MNSWTQIKSDQQPVNINLPGSNSAIDLTDLGVPNTAKEVLVYVLIVTGNLYDGFGSIQIYSTSANVLELYTRVYPQDAYSYNSDNLWIPIGEDRVVYAKYTGTALTKHSYAKFQVVGYR